MRLPARLLLVSLVTLLLPWAGCQYLRDMEEAMRSGQAGAVMATAEVLADLLAGRPDLFAADTGRLAGREAGEVIYAHALGPGVTLDGYVEDWGLAPRELVRLAPPGAPSLEYAAGVRGGFLWLFVQLPDDTLRLGPPGVGDTLRVRLAAAEGGFRDLLLAPVAPGRLVPEGIGFRPDPRIAADWEPASKGHSVELRVPLDRVGHRFGFLFTDRGPEGTAGGTVGTLPGLLAAPGWVVVRHPRVEEILVPALRPDMRLRVLDGEGYVLASVGEPEGDRGEGILALLARRVLRAAGDDASVPARPELLHGRVTGPAAEALLAADAPRMIRFRDRGPDAGVVAAARPFRLPDGTRLVLLAEQDAEAVLGVTDQAALRLFGMSVVLTGLIALLLLGFATWLSLRIRRLSRAAREAEGRVLALPDSLPETGSHDEVGELARSFSRLLSRVRDYNQYLQGLGGKLSHELRTPMAVVSTSLENLQSEPTGDHARHYLERARAGVRRLQAMVTALSEATRVEQAVEAADPVPLDLSALLEELAAAYAATAGELTVTGAIDPGCRVRGSPDLLAQMVDKLFENARDFCPPGGRITLGLRCGPERCLISVANTGSRLPTGLEERLFDSLVARREGGGEAPHLGLGLYIVRLIARRHGGEARARNLVDEAGVEFMVSLPLAGRAGSR